MNEEYQGSPWHILVVEDNPGDVFLIREALEEICLPYTMDSVTDGTAALDFLQMCRSGSQPWPNLLILDWNLPGKNGHQVLTEMQQTPAFHVLPVAVLSTCPTEIDIARQFPALRATYASKTPSFQKLVEILLRFRQFSSNNH